MSKPFPRGCKVIVTNELPQSDEHPGFMDEMKPWLFQIVTIDGPYSRCPSGCCYSIREDNGEYAWNHKWLRPLDVIMRFSDETAVLHYGGNIDSYKKREIKIADLVDRLSVTQEGSMMSTPILPSSAIHYSKRGNREIVVCELKPQIKSVAWTNLGYGDTQRKRMETALPRYLLAFPYIVIVCLFIDGSIAYSGYEFPKIFYRRSPIKSLNDELFHTNLQNVGTGKSWLCLHPEDIFGEAGCIEGQINSLMGELWGGVFTNNMDGNDDYHLSRDIDPSISSIEEWQRSSADDSQFVLNVEWKKTELTINRVIHQAFSGTFHERDTPRLKSSDQIADLMYEIGEA